MNIDGFGNSEIKNKIRALRSTYSQEKKKIKDSKKSGAGSDCIYVPNIKWFALIDTFLHCLEESKTTTQDNLIEDLTVPEDPHNPEDFTSLTPPKKFSKLQRVFSIVGELTKLSEKLTDIPNESEYEIFGRSVAAQLMTLSHLNAIKAQEKIQSVLTSFKLQQFHVVSQNPSTLSVRTPSISPNIYVDSNNSTLTNSLQSEYMESQYDQSNMIHMAFTNL
ncbi:hypothetical protein RN001_004720 [Aquatica leii]|uniref:MADF domain-containing protein n=1 Tax=Aquatica leii TaxID=1421715 RepID=A0AAN7SA81_9COLE|nr:hypothetical protein RN001_004720 [Aquatica leii]